MCNNVNSRYNRHEFEKWLRNPCLNPKTKRNIKIYGKTYKKIKKKYIEFINHNLFKPKLYKDFNKLHYLRWKDCKDLNPVTFREITEKDGNKLKSMGEVVEYKYKTSDTILPDEILLEIFSFIGFYDINNMKTVHSQFNRIISSEIHFKILLKRDYGLTTEHFNLSNSELKYREMLYKENKIRKYSKRLTYLPNKSDVSIKKLNKLSSYAVIFLHKFLEKFNDGFKYEYTGAINQIGRVINLDELIEKISKDCFDIIGVKNVLQEYFKENIFESLYKNAIKYAMKKVRSIKAHEKLIYGSNYSKEELEIWNRRRYINPKTGRKININGASYKKIEKFYNFYFKVEI